MAVGSDALALILADGCLAAAGRTPPGEGARRDKLLATGLAAIDALLGPPKVPVRRWLSRRTPAHARGIAAGVRWAGRGRRGAGVLRAGAGVAREKGALAWELRAAMSLVRLRARVSTEQQGRGVLSGSWQRPVLACATSTRVSPRGLTSQTCRMPPLWLGVRQKHREKRDLSDFTCSCAQMQG